MMVTRRLIFILSISLFLFCLGWEFWPDEVHSLTLKFEDIESQRDQNIECTNLDSFFEGLWRASYPERIELNDIGELVLTYVYSQSSFEGNVQDNCEILIEGHLELYGAKTYPGEKIISQFHASEEMKFIWHLEPIGQDLKGTLWIYSSFENKEGEETRMPMFAIPIEIKITSFLSLQPRTVRIIGGISSLLTAGIMFIFSPGKTRML